MEIDENSWVIKNIDVKSSPNFDLRPAGCEVDLLIIHNISLPPGVFGESYIDDLFCNRLDPNKHEYFAGIYQLKVSAHVLIRRNGNMTQFVPFDKRAWHAGVSEYQGRQACNDFSIGIELEGTDDCPFEDIQYQRLAEVTKIIMNYFPKISLERIVGHSFVAPDRKTDPGPAFDWTYYRSLLHEQT